MSSGRMRNDDFPDEQLVEMYETMTMKAIAEKTGLTFQTVAKRLNSLGISKKALRSSAKWQLGEKFELARRICNIGRSLRGEPLRPASDNPYF